MRIGKKFVKQVLADCGIGFGFPCNSKTGETITVWQDLYHKNGDTLRLVNWIKAHNALPVEVSETPANYLASIRLAFS